jgi:predicted  nucleic acid-binding Zn-ribbon protein
MQREVEAFKAAGQKHEHEITTFSSSYSAVEEDAAKAKARAASLEQKLSKSDQEIRRLQGYVKQLEAAQRLKDAQVSSCFVSVASAGIKYNDLVCASDKRWQTDQHASYCV